MAWFKVDDKFHSHPKVMEISTSAVGLWVLAGSWCADYLTDGIIRRGQIRRLGGTEDEAAELVAAGLWSEVPDGYQFRDWDDYQPTRESVLTKKRQDADRKRDGRRTQQRNRQGVQKESGRSPRGLPKESSGPVPVPVPESSNELSPARDSRRTDDEFEQWWPWYPKRVDVGDARESFEKARAKADLSVLIDGAKSYARSVTDTERRFIKSPARWLDAEAWSDEPEDTAPSKPTAWDYGPEAYMHPEERELERQPANGDSST